MIDEKIKKTIDGDKLEPEKADLNYNFGQLYRKQGDFDDALKKFKEALNIYKTIFGENHLLIASVNDHYGIAHYYRYKYSKNKDLKDIEDSYTLCNEGLKLRERFLGKNDPEIALSHGHLGLYHMMKATDLINKIAVNEKLQKNEIYEKIKNSDLFSKVIYEKIKKEWNTESIEDFQIDFLKIIDELIKAGEKIELTANIRSKKLNENHPRFIGTRINIGILNYLKAKFWKSLDSFEDQQKYSERALTEFIGAKKAHMHASKENKFWIAVIDYNLGLLGKEFIYLNNNNDYNEALGNGNNVNDKAWRKYCQSASDLFNKMNLKYLSDLSENIKTTDDVKESDIWLY